VNLLTVAGIAFVCAVLISFFRKSSAETVPVLIIASCGILLSLILPQVNEILTAVRELGSDSGIGEGELGIVCRGLGICLVTRFASNVCLDCGLRSVGEMVEYYGRIATVALALPLLLELADRIRAGF